jgi:large subunit ribosomal protein L23
LKAHDVILYPLMTERSVSMIENENKLVFAVNLKAGKSDIATAVRELYDVEAEEVRTLIDHRGVKKAFVRIKEGYNASDVAIRLGIL